MIDGGRPEWNQVRITAHETDIPAILHYLNDVASQQCPFAICAGWPVQDGAAFEMATAVDQHQTIPKVKHRVLPEMNWRAFPHHPVAIGSMQEDLRVELLGPFHHRRVKMGMGNCNGANAAARLDCPYSFFVEERDAIPKQISVRRPQKQSALTNGKFRFGPDPHKMRRLFSQAVSMTSSHSSKRRPGLAFMTHKLPFIFANWTGGWRLRAFIKLGSALNTDEVFHRGKFLSRYLGKARRGDL